MLVGCGLESTTKPEAAAAPEDSAYGGVTTAVRAAFSLDERVCVAAFARAGAHILPFGVRGHCN